MYMYSYVHVLRYTYTCVHVHVCMQVQEQLEASREQCHGLEAQIQKKEVALLAAQSKTELLTSDLQNKVKELCHVIAPYITCACVHEMCMWCNYTVC